MKNKIFKTTLLSLGVMSLLPVSAFAMVGGPEPTEENPMVIQTLPAYDGELANQQGEVRILPAYDGELANQKGEDDILVNYIRDPYTDEIITEDNENSIPNYDVNDEIMYLTTKRGGDTSDGRMYKETKNVKKVDLIVNAANTMVGKKYVYGGTTEKGFDNSGFIQYVFQKANINVPRTVKEQVKIGKTINKKDLKPGDILFFSNSNKSKVASFAGVYVGKDQFVAVTTKKGVTTIKMNDSYWKTKFVTAKRITN